MVRDLQMHFQGVAILPSIAILSPHFRGGKGIGAATRLTIVDAVSNG